MERSELNIANEIFESGILKDFEKGTFSWFEVVQEKNGTYSTISYEAFFHAISRIVIDLFNGQPILHIDKSFHELEEINFHIFNIGDIIEIDDWTYLEDSHGRDVFPESYESFTDTKFIVRGIGLFESLSNHSIGRYLKYKTAKLESIENGDIIYALSSHCHNI